MCVVTTVVLLENTPMKVDGREDIGQDSYHENLQTRTFGQKPTTERHRALTEATERGGIPSRTGDPKTQETRPDGREGRLLKPNQRRENRP